MTAPSSVSKNSSYSVEAPAASTMTTTSDALGDLSEFEDFIGSIDGDLDSLNTKSPAAASQQRVSASASASASSGGRGGRGVGSGSGAGLFAEDDGADEAVAADGDRSAASSMRRRSSGGLARMPRLRNAELASKFSIDDINAMDLDADSFVNITQVKYCAVMHYVGL